MRQKYIGYVVLLLSLYLAYYCYNYLFGSIQFWGALISGISIGMLLMSYKLNVKDGKIKLYMRELEKESISSENNSAKVKVLESKIKVLEKALDDAIKK